MCVVGYLLYTVAVGELWNYRAEAMVQSARDAGCTAQIYVQTKAAKKSLWSRYPANFTKYAASLPDGNYDRILYVDADCIFNKNPDELFPFDWNFFAADHLLIGGKDPANSMYGTALMQPYTIEKNKGKPIVNSGLWCVSREDYPRLCSAVLAIEEASHITSDQACLNHWLFGDSDISWQYWPEGLVAYDLLGEQEYPDAVVNHYLGGKHYTLDNRIRRQFPAIAKKAAHVLTVYPKVPEQDSVIVSARFTPSSKANSVNPENHTATAKAAEAQ